MANLKIENFTSNEFTKYLDSYGYDINVPFDLKQHCKLDIDPTQWFEFMSDNWINCYCFPYEPRPNLDPVSNDQTTHANRIGYHTGNSIKRDWGKNEPLHDDVFKEFIGKDNFDRMGVDPDTTLVRLLCYQPGNVFPVHWDGFEGWNAKFGIDKTPTRFSVLINPYSYGQYLQIHDKMITNWSPGDTYVIPEGVLHCSGKGGIVPKVTLTITGLME